MAVWQTEKPDFCKGKREVGRRYKSPHEKGVTKAHMRNGKKISM